MKRFTLLLFALIFSVGAMMAQRTVTGTVNDDTGESLIGANVLVKGTTIGTVTDIDGSFAVEVPDGSNTLVVSSVGYETKEFDVTGLTVLDVTLSTGELLSEIVVTGLGIKKEKKALGYGVTTLQSSAVANRAESDIGRILRGKATGVNINTTSGMAGSGTNILIRGFSSITGSNEPLFVVDGIPFNSESRGDTDLDGVSDATEGSGSTGGSNSQSSRFGDIDPNNIAEISILKGLSATVLYGEAGRNGVVLITTKNGADIDADRGLEVSVNQTISSSQVANLPNYQNTFGNGFSGNFGWFFSNWGPSFDTRGSNGVQEDGQIDHPLDQGQYNADFPEYIGADYNYQPYESVENFFQNGLSSNTSVAISNRLGDNGSFSATYSYLDDEGFLPRLGPNRDGGASNYLRKHNFGLGARTKLSNGLGVRGTFNYVQSQKRAPQNGSGFGGDGNGIFAALVFTPRSIDLNNLPYQSPIDGRNVYYRRGAAIQNPLWTLNNSTENEDIRRFYGTVQLDYELTPWLNAMYRLGVDQLTEVDNRRVNRGGPRDIDGRLETGTNLNRIADHVLNLAYNHQINDDLSLDGIVGTNFRKEDSDYNFLRSTNQFVFNLFNHSNFIDQVASSQVRTENTIGAYATATLAFRNFLYLNFQGRNDWTSTLEEANRSIFYPSASIAFVPTDAIPELQNNKVINYLKIRLGYGTSAGYPNPYQTRNTLVTATNQFAGPSGALNINSVSNRLGNPNLKQERHREIELGLEARFIENRIGIDLSLYTKRSDDLIIDLDLDPATGFTNTTVNAAAITNKGVELGLNITPVRGKVQWDANFNITHNKSTVEEVADGIDQVLIAGFTNLGNFAIPGEQYGVIQGTPFVRGTDGESILVDAQGVYVTGPDIEVIGDPNPDYQANWINTISWNGLSLGWQWSYTKGGDIYSSTIQALLARGNTTDTDVDRFLPLVLPGVKADGTPNDIQGYIGDLFFNSYFGANEGGIFDATNIRLREVSLSYNLPSSLLDNLPFGSARFTLQGENLWFSAPNFPSGTNFDPEVLSLGVGNGRGFDFRTGPTAKKVGATLSLTF